MIPRVSVLLCSYNQARYLAEAVESVLAQSCPDWELLLIDNGSTDDSRAVAERFRSHPRIRLHLPAHNRPITVRFNEGIRAAQGEFIAFLYSDDFFLPQKLERQLDLFGKLPRSCGVVYAPSRFRNQATGREWTSPFAALSGPALGSLLLRRGRCYPDMISPLTRRECFLRHPFEESIFAEGEAIFLRIALTHGFHMDAEPVAVSRDTGENRGRAIPVNVRYHMASLDRLRQDEAYDARRWDPVLRRHRNLLWRDNAYIAARLGGDRTWIRQALGALAAERSLQLLHWRSGYAAAMAYGGRDLGRWINRGLDALRRPAQQPGWVKGYGGASGD